MVFVSIKFYVPFKIPFMELARWKQLKTICVSIRKSVVKINVLMIYHCKPINVTSIINGSIKIKFVRNCVKIREKK